MRYKSQKNELDSSEAFRIRNLNIKGERRPVGIRGVLSS